MHGGDALGPAVGLTADVGELDDLLQSDMALLAVITSASIACGGHAGSESLMRALLRVAAARGVAVGAHPGYADGEGFGRRELGLDAGEIYALCRSQVGRLARVAAEHGLALSHAKPHGALYHRAMADADAAEALARGCLDAAAEVFGDPFASLVFVGLPGTPGIARWRELGLTVAREGFADRGYAADGSLLARGLPGSVLREADAVAAQAVRLARGGECDTLCVHGDTPGAAGLARAVRDALHTAGVCVGGGV